MKSLKIIETYKFTWKHLFLIYKWETEVKTQPSESICGKTGSKPI